jgi:UPF0716 protein FxsA
MALILLVVLFIGMPLLEIAVFIQVGGAIGVWPTIALTVATALAGSLLLRAQGLATLMRARSQMDRGELPAREMFDGVCLVVAGALLLVPGFVTDAIGLLLFVPPLRNLLRLLIARHIAAKVARGEARVFVHGAELGPGRRSDPAAGPATGPATGPGAGPRPRRPGGSPWRRGTVIEGDYRDVTPDGRTAGGGDDGGDRARGDGWGDDGGDNGGDKGNDSRDGGDEAGGRGPDYRRRLGP